MILYAGWGISFYLYQLFMEGEVYSFIQYTLYWSKHLEQGTAQKLSKVFGVMLIHFKHGSWKMGVSTGTSSACFSWCDSHGTLWRLSLKVPHCTFCSQLHTFTWHGLWSRKLEYTVSPLVLFGGLTWLFSFAGGLFSPPEGSFDEQEPRLKFCQSRCFLNDSFGESTFLCWAPWYKAGCQVAQLHLPAYWGWDE